MVASRGHGGGSPRVGTGRRRGEPRRTQKCSRRLSADGASRSSKRLAAGIECNRHRWFVRRDQTQIFDVPTRELVEARRVAKMPKDAGTSFRDQNLAEAISRTVLGVDRGVGAFPKQMVDVLIEEQPSWNGQATSVPTWWMEAWLVARLGGGIQRLV